jgi:RimJ/RimL family protein N-acetyltransferase
MPGDLVPQLETKRTVLRAWRQSDLDAHAGMSADPEVMRFLGGVSDRQQAWRSMALHAGHWALKGYGSWVVTRKSDGVLLGRVGLWEPEGWPGLEIGWTLARHAWGRGYALEAARAAMEWTWSVLEAPRLISVIAPDNKASVRLAERLGMRPVRRDTLDGATVVIYGVERPADDRRADVRQF